MFVRWRKRVGTKTNRLDGPRQRVTWSAMLLQCLWKNRKPRQRCVRYLGSISESRRLHQETQTEFWTKAGSDLDELDLSNEERQRVEIKLAEIVPRPVSL